MARFNLNTGLSMHFMLSRLLLFIVLAVSISSALGAELEEISEDLGCYPEDGAGEFGWVVRNEDSSNDTCLFAQFPRGNPENPYVKIQGKNIILHRISLKNNSSGRWETEEIFENRAAKLTVRLRYRLSRDSCSEVEEKCCGQEYEGLLEVSDSVGRKVYKVTRWSGS